VQHDGARGNGGRDESGIQKAPGLATRRELCDQTRGGSHWQTKSERNKLYSGQSWRLSRPKCALGPRPGARPDQGLRLSATGVFAGPGEPADCHRFRALKVPPGTPPRNEAGAAARRGSFYTQPLPWTGQWLVFRVGSRPDRRGGSWGGPNGHFRPVGNRARTSWNGTGQR
jgi:hypothetical protein